MPVNPGSKEIITWICIEEDLLGWRAWARDHEDIAARSDSRDGVIAAIAQELQSAKIIPKDWNYRLTK